MTSALLLVDVQRNMLDGDGAVPAAADVRAVLHDLLVRSREGGVPVVHVQNDGGRDDPDQPFTPGWELVFEPHEPDEVIRKRVCDTFTADPGLAERLRAARVETVVVAGMQSEFCVEETALGAIREGFRVVLPHDGHATYNQRDRDASAVSAEVEQRLKQCGVLVQPARGIKFSSAPNRVQ